MSIGHLTNERFTDYFAGRLPKEHEADIERHLADCDECAAVAQSVYGAAYEFDTICGSLFD